MMSSDRTGPTAQTVVMSRHAADQYRDRVRPGLDIDAARAELERLRDTGEVSSVAPEWLNAANPAPHYLLLGKDVVLPVLPQGDGWVATTCVARPSVTPARRAAKSARRASLASGRRARRRARF